MTARPLRHQLMITADTNGPIYTVLFYSHLEMIWGGPEEVHEVREQDADVAYHPQCVKLGDRRWVGRRAKC